MTAAATTLPSHRLNTPVFPHGPSRVAVAGGVVYGGWTATVNRSFVAARVGGAWDGAYASPAGVPRFQFLLGLTPSGGKATALNLSVTSCLYATTETRPGGPSSSPSSVGNRRRHWTVELGSCPGRGRAKGVDVRRLLLAAIALLLAGCAASDSGSDAPAQPTQAGGAPERRYQATTTVLESRDHGPELCLGVVLDSFPPQCGGVPIPNWRWDQVEGEQTASGTTWGRYQLVGAYDGASFTVSRADLAPQESPPSAEERFRDEAKPACAEPEGGWELPNPARRSERYLEPVSRAARAQPDFAGLWISYLAPMGNNVAEDPGEFVLNVAFTGDLARHQAELRPRWGGRLCVTHQQRTYRQLLEIQRELQGDVGAKLGLRVLSTGIRDPANAVDLMVAVLDERAREAVDARYGVGAVEATAVLTPVA